MTQFTSNVAYKDFTEADNGVENLNSKDKLLRSAEALFSSKGYRDVSVREIAAHAGVNSALVKYYFRGKLTLFSEVCRLHTTPLSKELMQNLETITKGGRTPSVEEILRAWLVPWLRDSNSPQAKSMHLGIFANMSREGRERTERATGPMQPVHQAFIEALHSCLPHLSQETLMWRLHFVMGALVFGIIQPIALTILSNGQCDPRKLEDYFDQILPYAVAGFYAEELGHQSGGGLRWLRKAGLGTD